MAVSICPPAVAQATPLGALKAAYLYNFAMFVTWPDEPKDVLQLCVVESPGDVADDTSLGEIEGRSVRHMKLRVRRGFQPNQLAACDLIYLPVVDNGMIEKLQGSPRHRARLIVGAGETAAALGAGIGMFVAADGRLAFDLNLGALNGAGLKFNTRLLPLARRVYQ